MIFAPYVSFSATFFALRMKNRCIEIDTVATQHINIMNTCTHLHSTGSPMWDIVHSLLIMFFLPAEKIITPVSGILLNLTREQLCATLRQP